MEGTRDGADMGMVGVDSVDAMGVAVVMRPDVVALMADVVEPMADVV